MTRLPDDLIDPAEGPLARRIGAFSDQAVFPIDPVAIAASAAVAGRRRTVVERLFGGAGAGARLALVGAGALIAAVAVGAAIGGGAKSVTPPTSVATAPAGTFCDSSLLSGRILGWDGAAGNRIATVELTNTSNADCQLEPYQLALVDGGNNGLILNRDAQPGVALAAGATVHTLIDVSNYCPRVPSTPVEPVEIHLDNPAERGDVLLAPATGGMSGVPPCNGAKGSAGVITQQPWAPGPAPTE